MSKEKPPVMKSPSAVKTVRELILWEYAKLIARGAVFRVPFPKKGLS